MTQLSQNSLQHTVLTALQLTVTTALQLAVTTDSNHCVTSGSYDRQQLLRYNWQLQQIVTTALQLAVTTESNYCVTTEWQLQQTVTTALQLAVTTDSNYCVRKGHIACGYRSVLDSGIPFKYNYQQMPKALDQEKQAILKRYWSEGMTSTGDKETILKASEEANIDTIKVKQWIGNERKRRGQAEKRGLEKAKDSGMLPCKTRKTSAYQMFKSDFLKTNLAKTLRESVGEGELQRRANALWKTASQAEKEEHTRKAEEANQNPQSLKMEKRRTRLKKLTSLIQECVDQLNDLGCPSLWIGHIDGTPERFFAKGVGQLANDETFTNYAVSSLINSVAKEKMEAAKSPTKECKTKGGKKRKKRAHVKDSERGTQAPSAAPVASGEPIVHASAGSLFQLMDANGKAVATGEEVTQTQVHGRNLGPGWSAFRVAKLLLPGAKPWPSFPTHSGEIEEGSFIAWPENKIKRLQPRTEVSKSAKETKSLMYPNHPNYGDSPSVLLQRPRHTRQK